MERTLYRKNTSWFKKLSDFLAKEQFARTSNSNLASVGGTVLPRDLQGGTVLPRASIALTPLVSNLQGGTVLPRDAIGAGSDPAPIADPAPADHSVPIDQDSTTVGNDLVTTIDSALEDPTPTDNGSTPYSPRLGGGGSWNNPKKDSSTETNSDQNDAGEENGNNNSIDKEAKDGETPEVPETPRDTTPPDTPIIMFPPENQFVFTSNTVAFIGEAEASSTIKAIYIRNNATTTATTTVNSPWNMELVFDQGTTTIMFSAVDEAGNLSSSTERALFVDSSAPDITLSSPECDASLSPNNCLTQATSLSFEWSTTAEDLSHFVLNINGEASTTSATSTTVSVADNEIFNFSVIAEDTFGNQSEPATLEIEVSSRPVVINEISWMGTNASGADEWIELFNTTSQPISFDESWVLYSETDDSPHITLEGVIPAKGFYLIERKNGGETDELTESPVTDVTADLWTSFGRGLSTGGEDLVLMRASTTIDRVPQCSNRWCGEKNMTGWKRSMERFDPFKAGDALKNWGSHNQVIKNGIDTEGNKILGTPKARNSINYQITRNGALSNNKTLTKENSPYLITSRGFYVGKDATLSIEPGVVIKFVSDNEPEFAVEGTLITQGTEAEPVVFTAFTDDEYGGDMNSDGICEPENASSTAVCPRSGAWQKIRLAPLSKDSSLSYTIIRYGGRYFSNTRYRGALTAEETNVSFDHVTIEHSQKYGLYLRNATSLVSNSTFNDNGAMWENGAAGLYVAVGNVRVSNSLFEKNTNGAYIYFSPDTVFVENTFVNNRNEALRVRGRVGVFTDNDGEGNGMNAIIIGGGAITKEGATTTLYANPLSYFIERTAEVVASSTLTFKQGAVLKTHQRVNGSAGGITVKNKGNMVFSGENTSDLVFTSEHDDSVGSIIYATEKEPSAGDWSGIAVEEGGKADLEGFTVRFGGDKRSRRGRYGALQFFGGGDVATSTIRNALFENNYQYGVRLFKDAVTIFEDVLLRGHIEKRSGTASSLRVENAYADIRRSTFEDNELDIEAVGDAYTIVADEATRNGTPSTVPSDLLE